MLRVSLTARIVEFRSDRPTDKNFFYPGSYCRTDGVEEKLMPMGRSLSTIGYCAFSRCLADLCQCSNLKRMLASLFFALFFSRQTAFAASSSSSFGISAPVPLSLRVLSLQGDAAALARPSNRNVSEWPLPPNEANSADGTMAKQPNNQLQSADLCDQLHLTSRQKQICIQGGDGLAETLLEAIRMSVYTCQQQFEYERWNCTLHGHSRILTLKKAYKETAALYAFSAAGISHAVARACAAGRLRKCHCAEAENEVETRQTWRWGGCGDNLAYGRSFATKFLDSGSTAKTRPSTGGKPGSRPDFNTDVKLNKKKKSKSKDDLQSEMEAVSRALRRWTRTITSNTALAHSSRLRKASSSMSAETGGGGNFVANGPLLINKSRAGGKKHKNESQRQRFNRHNNAVGLKVVEQLVKRTCKCHGVSGSCSVKTCWNQLAAFSETAALIKNKYDNAVQVNVEIHENSSQLKTVSSASKNQESNRIRPQSRAKKGTNQEDEATVAALARNGGSGSTSASDRIDRKEMIYQQKSPDFCVPNLLGSGTIDRRCLRGENCDILCCGRGYNVHRLTVSSPCKCKLVLCCQVECQTCLVEKTVHTCK